MTIHSIIRSSALLVAGNGLAKILFFICHILIIRKLEENSAGVFAYLFATATLVAAISELGIRGYGIRELPRFSSTQVESVQLVARTVMARLTGLSAAALFFVLFSIPAFKYEQTTLALLALLFLYAAADSFSILCKGLLRSLDMFWPDAVIGVAAKLCSLIIIASWGYYNSTSLVWVALAFALPALFEACAYFVLLIKKLPDMRHHLKPANPWPLIKLGLPFALIGIVSMLYVRTGILSLEWFYRGDARVPLANLNVATRIPEGVGFLPVALANALLPSLVRRAGDLQFARRSFDMLIRHVGSIGIGLTLVLIVRAEDWITLIFKPQYKDAALTFQLLAVTVITSFGQYIMANQLIALNAERRVMRRYISSLVLNVILALLLVPQYGSVGVGIAIVISELSGMMLDGYALYCFGITLTSRTLLAWIAIGLAVLAMWWITLSSPVLLFGILAAAGCAICWMPFLYRDLCTVKT